MDKQVFAVRSPLEVGDTVVLNGNDWQTFTVHDILAVHSARHADAEILYDLGRATVTLDFIRGRLVDGKLIPIGSEQIRCEKVE